MNYRDLKWGELKSFAKSQGINTKGKKKDEILQELDAYGYEILSDLEPSKEKMEQLKEFKGIKEEHPFFTEVEEYVPYLKAYNKISNGKMLKVTSNVEGI